MAIIEMRQYLRKFSMDDLRNGLQPVRQYVGPAVNGVAPVDLFCPPILQYRVKEKVHVDGKAVLEWSEWAEAPFVREGEIPISE